MANMTSIYNEFMTDMEYLKEEKEYSALQAVISLWNEYLDNEITETVALTKLESMRAGNF